MKGLIFMAKKPTALIIMDGCGINKDTYGNAVAAAKKPNLDRYLAEWPHTTIGASGMCVGLPDGQMGNSEVGHTNMGAGRIVYQMLVKISKDISPLTTAISSRTRLLTKLSTTARRTAPLFISSDFSPTAAFTHTTLTSTVF